MEVAQLYIGRSTVFDQEKKNPQTLKFTSLPAVTYQSSYYAFPSWQNHINCFKNSFLVKQEKLGLIIGANGCGKTTLLSRLASEIQEDFCVHTILGDPKLRLEDLVENLKTAFEIPDTKDIITLEQIDQIVYQFLSRQHKYFLLVDDAHKLPIETLEGLLRVANNAKDSRGPKILLCGDVYLKKRIENLQEKLGRQETISAIELSPLSLAESREYIDFWVIKMDADRTVFSELILQRIYNLSGGFPGRINRVVQQITRDRKKFEQQFGTQEDNEEQFLSHKRHGLRNLLLLFLTLGITCYYFYCYVYQHPTDKKAVVAKKLPVHKSLAVHKTTTRNHLSSIQREKGFAYIASIAGLPIEHIQPTTIPTQQIVTTVQSQFTTAAVHRDDKPVNKNSKMISNSLESIAKHSLDKKKHLSYTIQLMAGSHKNDLQRYSNLPELKENSRIIHSSLQGKDWYVLVYGEFENREQASLALQEVSEQFKTQKPWIRKLASLSKQ